MGGEEFSAVGSVVRIQHAPPDAGGSFALYTILCDKQKQKTRKNIRYYS